MQHWYSSFKLKGAVEIDESLFTHKDKTTGGTSEERQMWVLGMYERSSGIAITQFVPRRSIVVLKEVIEKYIEPGTTIYTDGWRGYRFLKDKSLGYDWKIVNHVIGWGSGDMCTNRIESLWANLKGISRKIYNGRTPAQKAQEFVDELMARRNCKKFDVDMQDALITLLRIHKTYGLPAPETFKLE